MNLSNLSNLSNLCNDYNLTRFTTLNKKYKDKKIKVSHDSFKKNSCISIKPSIFRSLNPILIELFYSNMDGGDVPMNLPIELR